MTRHPSCHLALPFSGQVSDVRDLAEDMRTVLLATGAFELHAMHRSDAHSRVMPRTLTAAVQPGEGAGAGPCHAGKDRSADQPPSHESKPGNVGGVVSMAAPCTGPATLAAVAVAETVREGSGAELGSPSWLRARPYGLPTERDLVCEALWRPVYRTLLVRTGAGGPGEGPVKL